jgi:hypothetical protein
VCPLCGADMRVIAFITDPATMRDILVHLGEPSTSRPPIRHSRPHRPSSSTSASPGSQNRRRSSLRDAGLARARGHADALGVTRSRATTAPQQRSTTLSRRQPSRVDL